MPTPQEVQSAIQNNMRNRLAVVQNAMPMMQPLQTQTISALNSSNNVLTFQPRLTGLIVGFLVEVNGTYTNAGANVGNRTNGGALNSVSRIAFTDLNNYTRVNTNGYHLGLLNNVKNTRGFGGAVAPNLPYNVGNVWNVNSLPATIAASGGTAALRQFFYVPVAYSAQDLTGAVNAQVVNATMQLQITLNAAPGAVATDPLFKVYNGLVAASDLTMSNISVSVTTLYYNTATPRGGNFPLPMVDLSRAYLVQDQVANLTVVANQDCAAPFANARTYYSTFAVYDNNGVFNTGSDMTYLKLQYANLLAQWQLNPQTVALLTRNAVGFDMPPGIYYIDHRSYPISTQSWGNAELDINPSSVTAGAFLGTWYEMVANENTIIQASSL
jgi:hypothetical protein